MCLCYHQFLSRLKSFRNIASPPAWEIEDVFVLQIYRKRYMTFHFMPWLLSKVKYAFFFNISKTMRDLRFICITDLKETIIGLLFYVMTFNLGQRSKDKGVSFFSISKTMRDRSSFVLQNIWNHISAFVLCHKLWPWSKVKLKVLGDIEIFWIDAL